MHFDDDETWTTATRPAGTQPIDLVTVAAHEIGHGLGLDHTSVSGSLMLSTYTSSHRFLGTDDFIGITSLYGYSRANVPISGPNLICSTGSFSISGVPSGVSISWSTNNPSGLSINSSGSVARIGSFSGEVEVIATLSTSCGSTTVKKYVWVGNPNLIKKINTVIAGTTPVSAGNLYSLTATSGSPNTTFNYNNYTGTGNMSISIYSPNSADTQMYVSSLSTSGSRHVRVTATNTCGSYYEDYVFYLMPGMLMAYPNPAKDILTIEIGSTINPELLPESLNLINEKTGLTVKTVLVQQMYSNMSLKDGNKIDINVRDLPRGTYYLHVIAGKKSDQKTEKMKILLE